MADVGYIAFLKMADGSRYEGSRSATKKMHGYGMWTDATGAKLYEGQL